jgi:type IV secretion system protein VirB1
VSRFILPATLNFGNSSVWHRRIWWSLADWLVPLPGAFLSSRQTLRIKTPPSWMRVIPRCQPQRIQPPARTVRPRSWLTPRTLGSNRVKAGIAAIVAAGVSAPAPTSANSLNLSDFGQLALRCGPSVAPSTLASIARIESDLQPFAINDNTTGTKGAPATRDIAVQIASKLVEAGHSVDLGIMQINSRNFAALGLTVATAFDPCKSVAAGAVILAGDYAGGETHDKQQSALRIALSKYNTGDAQRGFANGYVHHVELAARGVVPALDVSAPGAAIDAQKRPTAAAAAPIDPNAPPSWDVWSSFDYAAMHKQDTQPSAPPSPDASPAVPTDAERGPSAAVMVSGPAVER